MKMKTGTEGLFKRSVVAVMVMVLAQGCGEGGSSSAGVDYANDQTSGGTDNGGTDNGGNGGNTYDSSQMLANLTDNVIVPTYNAFQARTGAQQQSISEYCTALIDDAANASTQQLAAQTDWKLMADVWQRAEMMQVGPLAANSFALRNTIYSWPVVSRCGVDQDVVYFQQGDINGTPYVLNQRTDTRRGIDALEHLLFSDNLDHNCSGNVGPLVNWNTIADNERMLARCQFALAVADDLQINATTLVNAWAGENGYAATLKGAGDVGNTFDSALKGVNAVTDAMFYLDSVTKDGKLGKPLGLQDNNCNNDICPEQVEAQPSGYSVQSIMANLKGFSQLFFGSQSGVADEQTLGFDDFLKDVGDEQTAQAIAQGLEQAQQLAEQLDQPIDSLLSDNPQKVEDLHSDIKAVTDQLKTDFITSLALELPQTSAGDND